MNFFGLDRDLTPSHHQAPDRSDPPHRIHMMNSSEIHQCIALQCTDHLSSIWDTFRIFDLYLFSTNYFTNNNSTIKYFISLSCLITSTQCGMALMEKVYSGRWHLLSPPPTPFSSPTLLSLKRFSSWSSLLPQAHKHKLLLRRLFFLPLDLFHIPFPLFSGNLRINVLFKMVPNVGWTFEKCVCPKCSQIHSLRKLCLPKQHQRLH